VAKSFWNKKVSHFQSYSFLIFFLSFFRDGGTCEVIKTACPNSLQFREFDTTKNTFECKSRPTILEKSLTENIHTIKSALSTDIKATTNAIDLQHAFMRVIFLAGIHHTDVFGVQEIAVRF